MAAPTGPTDLTLSGIVDGQEIDAADVAVPFVEAETAIDEARTTLAVSDTDSTVKYLQDALQAGSGITINKVNAGGDEALEIVNDGGVFLSAPDTPDSYAGAAHDVPTVNAGETALEFGPAVPAGSMLPYLGGTAPAGWLLCAGQAVSMTTYKRLLDALITGADMATVWGLDTGTAVTADAATDKILWTGHGLANGTVIMFMNSGGALPGGISANTPYYVINAATNDFQISTSAGGAAVDITDAGSGTHTAHTSYKVPDLRGRVFAGLDNMGGSSANVVTDAAADGVGGTMGEETHTLTESEIPSHTHIQTVTNSGTISGDYSAGSGSGSQQGNGVMSTASAGGDGAHNNMQPSLFGNWIIKY